jgi:hypothetical protein
VRRLPGDRSVQRGEARGHTQYLALTEFDFI